ncbi:crotonobetainyl-CoA:carnitine CoA-transferase CaiB-like acyl-CoA transferase [Bacillus fengqiuensis]|nr:crotonobetainyl-CoA:carnitine CoA-transferase CaiB-like acyl-CoA transferase [Bacillus fengqiuensis]
MREFVDGMKMVNLQVFNASDGQLAIEVGDDEQFWKLAVLLDKKKLAQSERFKTNSARIQHREQLAKIIEKQLKTKRKDTWKQLLDLEGIQNSVI